ncbi:MAG: YcbK family protein [Alphaproteobacteria bacterium]
MFDDLNDQKLLNDLNTINRRDVLKLGLVGVVGSLMPLFPSKNAYAISNFASWRISFRNAHTGESFSGVYRVGDKYLPESFERMNYVLRDHRTDEIFPMDPRIIDIVKVLQDRTKDDGPIEVLSGYRSPKTNAKLRNASTGVARNSFHMYGQAMDIRVPGYSTRRLRDVARKMKSGGVGYYPKSNFVHVDTGKVRSW